MVMELLEGETLRHRLRRACRLAPRDTARIITEQGSHRLWRWTSLGSAVPACLGM